MSFSLGRETFLRIGCSSFFVLRYDGSFAFMLWPDIRWMGRITSDAVSDWAMGEGKEERGRAPSVKPKSERRPTKRRADSQVVEMLL